jgi:cation diffusion facilitator CzcD-associated flavoprotein CzcO
MARHRIVIVGGGSAGVTVAARLRRKGQTGVTVIDPAATHYYQPLWTLVGGGCAPVESSAKPRASVMPKGVTWIRQAAVGVELAEFDYSMKPKPSIPVINTVKERRDMWYLKRYGLPALYWQLMLRGLA